MTMKLELLPRTDLAVRAMRYLGRHPGSSSSEMAGELGTSFGYLTQVLRPLVDRGYVNSWRGPKGGYRLAVPLESVSMLDIIEVMEGPTDTGICVLKGSTCDASEPCGIHDAWMAARSALMDHLASVSVGEG